LGAASLGFEKRSFDVKKREKAGSTNIRSVGKEEKKSSPFFC